MAEEWCSQICFLERELSEKWKVCWRWRGGVHVVIYGRGKEVELWERGRRDKQNDGACPKECCFLLKCTVYST